VDCSSWDILGCPDVRRLAAGCTSTAANLNPWNQLISSFSPSMIILSYLFVILIFSTDLFYPSPLFCPDILFNFRTFCLLVFHEHKATSIPQLQCFLLLFQFSGDFDITPTHLPRFRLANNWSGPGDLAVFFPSFFFSYIPYDTWLVCDSRSFSGIPHSIHHNFNSEDVGSQGRVGQIGGGYSSRVNI